METKNNLRKKIKEILKGIDEKSFEEKSRDLSLNLKNTLLPYLPETKNSQNTNFHLGVFAPMKDEALWWAELKELNPYFAFPGLPEGEKKEMLFYHAKIEELIETKIFGTKILTPPPEAKVVTPSIVLVPALAFTLAGNRLGRGGGFYDRYLNDFPGLKIGISFEEQLIDTIPTEAHDKTVDLIITNARVHKVVPHPKNNKGIN